MNVSIGVNVFVNFESASERDVVVRWFRVMNEIVCESKKKVGSEIKMADPFSFYIYFLLM